MSSKRWTFGLGLPCANELVMKSDEAIHALYLSSTRKAAPAAVAEHLSALENSPSFPSVFVREAMRWGEKKAPSAERWVETLKALSRVGRQYSAGDLAFWATVKALQAPWLLAAVQAATVSAEAPLVVLAALAHDGSDSSHDALLSEFERTRQAKSDRLLRLKLLRLGRYAKANAHFAALEAAVRQELSRRDGSKVEGSLAQQLGLHVQLLKFVMQVDGTKAQRAAPVRLIISGDDKSSGLPTQAVGLESTPPRDFLQVRDWLSKVTLREKVTWRWARAQVTTNLRGKHREAMVAWLLGKAASPVA